MKQLKNFVKTDNSQNPLMDEAVKKYGGLSEDELIDRLVENIKQQKKDGTFNAEQMFNVVNMMSSYITEKQHDKLINIIKVVSVE